MNDQRSLKDQLTDLAAMADRAGMYDAADYVRRAIGRGLARERHVLEVAERVRDGRYSAKTALTREDRTLFDEFNAAVDALRYP